MLKKVTGFVSSMMLTAAVPLMAAAQQFNPSGGPFGTLLGNIIEFSNRVLIPFLLGLGFLWFVWGMFQYFIRGAADEDAQSAGKQTIIYSVAGFVLIFIFWGVITLVTQSTGLNQQSLPTNLIPRAPGT